MTPKWKQIAAADLLKAMPKKCSKIDATQMLQNLIFQQNFTKKPPKKGVTFLTFGGLFRVRFQDGSRMAPGPPKSSKNHKQTQIFYNMFKHFCTFGNRFFLRFAAQNSICFALPTSLFHRAAGQATRWNKSLGPPRLHSRSCFFMSVGFRKNI